VRRREFITLLGGATVAWPLAARAQQPEKLKKIGVLMGSFDTNDPLAEPELKALREELLKLGWLEGRNIKIEYRWGGGNVGRIQAIANELIGLDLDLIVTRATAGTAATVRATSTIPIVFVQVSDPVGDGFVTSFARPGGNVTGFTNIEATMSGKWLELLKELVPGLPQAVFLFHPETAPGGGEFFTRAFKDIAPSLGIRIGLVPARTGSEIENALLKVPPNGESALIVSPGGLVSYREPIYRLVTGRRIPAIYPFTFWVRDVA
jgi:putative ABC transport system substrate-binding protein